MPAYNFDFSAAIVAIAGKLAKLVVQLDAENHEVARKAILRELRNVGCKLPDLGGIVERAALLGNADKCLTAAEGEQIFQHAYAQGRQSAQGKPPNWREIIDICWTNKDRLDARDQDFIRNWRSRILFDDDEPGSEKVQKWIRDCYRKVHNGHSI
jgi:hypothetical protein